MSPLSGALSDTVYPWHLDNSNDLQKKTHEMAGVMHTIMSSQKAMTKPVNEKVKVIENNSYIDEIALGGQTGRRSSQIT